MTEDGMVGWHRRLNGHEFEQAPGDGERQGSLACCSPWSHEELGTTELLNNNTKFTFYYHPKSIVCIRVHSWCSVFYGLG